MISANIKFIDLLKMILVIFVIQDKFNHNSTNDHNNYLLNSLFSNLNLKYNISKLTIKNKKYLQSIDNEIGSNLNENKIILTSFRTSLTSDKEISRLSKNFKNYFSIPIEIVFILDENTHHFIDYPIVKLENANIPEYINILNKQKLIIPKNWYRYRILNIGMAFLVYNSISVISRHQSINL